MQSNGINALAIRRGTWKLIPAAARKPGGKGKRGTDGRAQLFNLAEDLSETKNVADEDPQVVKEMSALLEQVRAKAQSRP